MTREQPANDYLVRPLFQELGFDLLYIENPFDLPEETMRSVTATGLDITLRPEPDVLLSRDKDKKAARSALFHNFHYSFIFRNTKFFNRERNRLFNRFGCFCYCFLHMLASCI